MIIFYQLGVLKESKNRDTAQLLYGFIQSEHGMSKMEQYGFSYLLK
ncbi:hypothetical protein DFO70_102142 [Cytobacillus firmus]|uniref:Uncharacterized protein n=2 Tax=Cytobacillus TaxID=2675230 RepID=A0A366K3G3_CYTFI|nr:MULTISPECIES: hypothetical protein [Cytobacillus]RBP95817.1 hypothetical protein DFO70_102142 [Cytobacillus firmus]TDX44730.1 hypothetical protein DFO72_103142 [Cytobacillus oceanisediminis]